MSNTIKDLVSNIEKRFGKEAIAGNNSQTVEFIHSGSYLFDEVLGGGWAKGRIVEIFGSESCLCGWTKVSIHKKYKDTENLYMSHRKKTIASVFNSFHKRKDLDFFITCIDERTNRVLSVQIEDVVMNGMKNCYLIETEEGSFLKGATEDHLFYIGEGKYKQLKELQNGDIVYIHNKTRVKKDQKKYKIRKNITVKYHPSLHLKYVNGQTYCLLEYYVLVYEAYKNNLDPKEYRRILNQKTKEEIDNFWHIPEGYDIHHKDNDPTNDDISNLEMIEAKEHNRIHAIENIVDLSFITIPQKIKNIKFSGYKKVYDIKCKDPYHNFIADGFVVHNCGKTTAAIHVAAEVQKQGRAVGYVDVEQAMDPDYIKALGVDMSEDKWILSQPDTAEQALEIVREMCECKEIGLVVLDSVAGLTPNATLQGESGDVKVALVARLMSSQLNILKTVCKRNNCTLICINQIRDKVGGAMVGFGGATTQTTGGRALRFYSSQRVEMSRIGSEKEGEEQVANKTRISVKKNKVAIPFKKCDISIRFGVGFDKIQEILNLAVDEGVCTKKGAWFYYGDFRLGQGLANTREMLEKDVELFKEIKEMTLNKFKNATD